MSKEKIDLSLINMKIIIKKLIKEMFQRVTI